MHLWLPVNEQMTVWMGSDCSRHNGGRAVVRSTWISVNPLLILTFPCITTSINSQGHHCTKQCISTQTKTHMIKKNILVSLQDIDDWEHANIIISLGQFPHSKCTNLPNPWIHITHIYEYKSEDMSQRVKRKNSGILTNFGLRSPSS